MVLTPLPQNGIEATMIEPPSINRLYPDPDETLWTTANMTERVCRSPRLILRPCR